jgi:hypothetical protein
MIGVLMISDLLYDGARYNLIMLYGNPGDLHFFNNPAYGAEFLWTPFHRQWRPRPSYPVGAGPSAIILVVCSGCISSPS